MIILFSGILHAQKPVADIERKLLTIEKMLMSKPDSARMHIRTIIDAKVRHHDTIYAMANSYHGFYHLLKNSPDSAIYYYDKALGYAENSTIHRAKALRLMGGAYRKKANYEKSLQLLNRAEAEYLSINNNKGLATVYGEIASNYNAMLRAQDAIPYLLKAIGLLEKAKNKKEILPIKQSLANTYMNIGNYEFAVELYEETLAGFKENGALKNYYLTLINYGDCLTLLKRYETAERSLLEALSGVEKFNDAELIGSTYATLGRLKILQKFFLQGEIYYEKAFNIQSSINSVRTLGTVNLYLSALEYFGKTERAMEVIALTEKSAFKGKANIYDLSVYEKDKINIYEKAKKYELAATSAKTAIELIDTLNKTQDKTAVIAMQAKIQRDYQSRKSDILVKKNNELKKAVNSNRYSKWFWVSLSVTLLIVIGGYHFYNNARYKNKMAKVKANLDTLASKQQSAHSLNESLKSDIEEKHKELEDIEFEMVRMKENINTMIDLSGTPAENRNANLDLIKNELKHVMGNDDYRERFSDSFSASNAVFEETLSKTYPQLSKKDLYFCSLINLNLPYKDLAIILQVVPEAVRKRKYRLKKKMGLNEDENLEKLLATIFKKINH